VNDLKNLHTELAQFNSDLDTVRVRLESEVQDYWNVAEVKRIHFESLEEQLRLAKQEWNDATKVYQNANKRMKTELSSREKRIKDIRKRIEKAESNIEKRVKDLDREKEKMALSG
jgi:predicted  nucleic acid-binding Zn-ribbon protein